MATRAPIALIAYRRPKHLAATLSALERCIGFEDAEIYAYCDGARSEHEIPAVNAVRELLHSKKYRNFNIIEQPNNIGLANSVIGAVSSLCNEHGKAIVVEDDLLLHPLALEWFNLGLDTYEDVERVMQIGAYQYNIPEYRSVKKGIFQEFATTWGWATWKRAWDKFDPNATGWESVLESPETATRFNSGDAYPFSEMLIRQMRGEIDSWGIRWSWSVFRAQGLTLMPPQTLCTNTGLDMSGTHNSVGFLKKFVSGPQPARWKHASLPELPERIGVSPSEVAAFRGGLRRTNAMRNLKIKNALARLGFGRFAD